MAIGIIAEYNPFHNGHKYQLEQAKARWPHEKIIVILSGKYVQRGEIAVASFDQRKAMALTHGASEVIELPFEYATQAAHIFAQGAVDLAYKAGVTKLFFGSESNNPEQLLFVANAIKKNTDEYNKKIKAFLKLGYSFPKSAAMALTELIGYQIDMPNDILGLEYCKAIVNNDYPIQVFTLARTIPFKSKDPNEHFASASYIRSELKFGNDVSKYTPMKLEMTFEKIEDRYGDFQKIICATPANEIAKIQLISEGMENLFKKNIHIGTYDGFVAATNSRRYTSSRIKRAMLYVLLGITK